jgi:hypothetical protein
MPEDQLVLGQRLDARVTARAIIEMRRGVNQQQPAMPEVTRSILDILRSLKERREHPNEPQDRPRRDWTPNLVVRMV